MSITEGRQEVARTSPSSRRYKQGSPLSGLVRNRSTSAPSNCPDSLRTPPCGQSNAKSHDALVYTAYSIADSQPTHLSGHSPRNRNTDYRLVAEDVSDELLLNSIAEGDKAAMHIMFARHRGKVSRFIQRMVNNPAVVEDIVSQVFLDVWRSANRFEGRAQVSTWLLSIARFKAISSLRTRTHETIDQDDVNRIADDRDDPEHVLDRKEKQEILLACIEQLSPAHREIIDLFYYREKSVSEMSEAIGIPRATVKSRMFYARKQLAGILMIAGFDAVAVGSVDEARRA